MSTQPFQQYENRYYPIASTSTQFPPTPEDICEDEGCLEACTACPSLAFVGWKMDGCEQCEDPIDCCDLPVECCEQDCSGMLPVDFQSYAQELNCNECTINTGVGEGSDWKGKGRMERVEDTVLPRLPDSGYGDLFSLDDQTLEEILNCCCCGPDSGQLPPSHDCHHISHDPAAHLNSGLQSLSSTSTSGNHSQITTPAMQSPAFPPVTFDCRWGVCGFSFVDKAALVAHVHQDHLFLPKPLNEFAILPLSPTSIGMLNTPSAPYDCNDCYSNIPALSSLPALTHSPNSSSTSSTYAAGTPISYPTPLINSFTSIPNSPRNPVEDPIKAATDVLVKHLLEKHLAGLEDGVALTWAAALTNPPSRRPSINNSKLSTSDISVHSTNSHSVPHSVPHTHSHSSHSHSQRNSEVGPHKPHSHVHHGHPYGVHPRSSKVTTPIPVPIPSLNGSHRCKWINCNITFDTSSDLMQHLSADHVGSGKASYSCEWDGCDRKVDNEKGFAQRQKVMRHLQTHTGDRPFVCDVCLKSFSEATTLTQHKRVHTNERPYKCTHPGCEKDFSLASALTIHTRTHTGDKPFKCSEPGCESTFSESSNLSKHVRTHKGDKTHICDLCQKGFTRSDQLIRHKRTHTGKVEVELP